MPTNIETAMICFRASRSTSIGRIIAVELAQQGLEPDMAEIAVSDPLRGRDRGVDDLLSGHGEPGAALRRELDLTRALEVVHEGESLGDGASVRERAVVAQEHHALVGQIGDEAPLFC